MISHFNFERLTAEQHSSQDVLNAVIYDGPKQDQNK